VPINVPVNDPLNEPVLICAELLTIPAGSMVGANDAEVANEAVDGVNVIEVAAEAVVAKDAVAGTKVMEVAALAVDAKEDDTVLFAQLDVPIKTPVNDPLNEPVLICVEDDTVPTGSTVGANDAEVANDAVAGVNVIEVAALAVDAKDDDTALLAQLEVPINVPTNDPLNEPVLI